jgi:hypothetical protein
MADTCEGVPPIVYEVPVPYEVVKGTLVVQDNERTVLDAAALEQQIQAVQAEPTTNGEISVTGDNILRRLERRPRAGVVLSDAARFLIVTKHWPTEELSCFQDPEYQEKQRRQLMRTLDTARLLGDCATVKIIESQLATL